MLGKSSVGQDQIWIENATKLRDLLRQTRNLKSEQEQLITLQTENEFLRAHNNCLKSQLQELLIQMGKTTSIAGANSFIDK